MPTIVAIYGAAFAHGRRMKHLIATRRQTRSSAYLCLAYVTCTHAAPTTPFYDEKDSATAPPKKNRIFTPSPRPTPCPTPHDIYGPTPSPRLGQSPLASPTTTHCHRRRRPISPSFGARALTPITAIQQRGRPSSVIIIAASHADADARTPLPFLRRRH